MTDYVIKSTELTKGMTLGEYIKLKGLTEKNWLLIYDYRTGKLKTGVRADGLTPSEKCYYVVTVNNYIFPQYTSYSEQPYYIIVYVTNNPVYYLTPMVYTETEVKAPEPPVEDGEELAEENIFEPLEEKPIEDITLDIKSLTPLEIAFFEQVYETECDLEDETIDHEFNSYVSEFIFGEIMKKSNSFNLYWLWRDERKKQEAVTVI